MNILGLSFFYHDSAAAIIKDGKVIALAEEERFSRKKNDSEYPEQAIEFCLKEARISPKSLDYVVFYEKPFLKFERIFLSSLTTYPFGWKLFREAMKEWFFHKLWVKEVIASKLDISSSKVLFSKHHISHAASSFYPSGLKESAILTIDGVGEWSTATIAKGEGRNIKILKELHFPHSLGLLYSTFTAFLGFEVNEGEYKVMGMAPFGKPKYVNKIKRMIKIFPDGSLKLNLRYFAHPSSPDTLINDELKDLFGPPRKPGTLFFTKTSGFPKYFGDKPKDFAIQVKENQHYADIAASIQAVCEEVVLTMAKAALKETGSKNLCMAGGVALNSVSNGKLIKKLAIKNLFIQPAAGDAGGALGAALYAYQQMEKRPKPFLQTHAYWGKSYDDDVIEAFLKKNNIKYTKYKSTEGMIRGTAKAIANGSVIGWFQGRFEWGPRALGNRSILADPRRADMKDIINTKIKFREPYRPFAPSVLEGEVEKFFEYKENKNGSHSEVYGLKNPDRNLVNQRDPSPPNRRVRMTTDPALFMLMVIPVKQEKKKIIPAVTHVDGTARIQIVKKSANPLYWNLINEFSRLTRIPILLNTSFNLKGEPIVAGPEDAYSTFMRSGMDMLVMGRFVIQK